MWWSGIAHLGIIWDNASMTIQSVVHNEAQSFAVQHRLLKRESNSHHQNKWHFVDKASDEIEGLLWKTNHRKGRITSRGLNGFECVNCCFSLQWIIVPKFIEKHHRILIASKLGWLRVIYRQSCSIWPQYIYITVNLMMHTMNIEAVGESRKMLVIVMKVRGVQCGSVRILSCIRIWNCWGNHLSIQSRFRIKTDSSNMKGILTHTAKGIVSFIGYEVKHIWELSMNSHNRAYMWNIIKPPTTTAGHTDHLFEPRVRIQDNLEWIKQIESDHLKAKVLAIA
jgi:hypothetical protein